MTVSIALADTDSYRHINVIVLLLNATYQDCRSGVHKRVDVSVL